MPSFSNARWKFMCIDFACPICKYPLGSGGKRVRIWEDRGWRHHQYETTVQEHSRQTKTTAEARQTWEGSMTCDTNREGRVRTTLLTSQGLRLLMATHPSSENPGPPSLGRRSMELHPNEHRDGGSYHFVRCPFGSDNSTRKKRLSRRRGWNHLLSRACNTSPQRCT